MGLNPPPPHLNNVKKKTDVFVWRGFPDAECQQMISCTCLGNTWECWQNHAGRLLPVLQHAYLYRHDGEGKNYIHANLPSFGMNWREPSSVSWSSVRMSTMFGLEFGFGFGRLRISNLVFQLIGQQRQSIQIQPPGLVDKFGVWWVVWAGKVQRLAATWPPELISSLDRFSWCAPGGWPGGEGEEEEDQVHHDLPFSLSLGFALNSPSLDHNLLKGSSLYSFRCNWLTLHKRCQECTPPKWWSLLDLERGKRSKGNTSCKKPIEAAYYQQRAGEPEHLGFFICVLASRGLGCRVKPMKINDDIPSTLTRKISHKVIVILWRQLDTHQRTNVTCLLLLS